MASGGKDSLVLSLVAGEGICLVDVQGEDPLRMV